MKIDAIDEYNKNGHLIYSGNYIGAYVRGKMRDKALAKFPLEIAQYCRWLGIPSEGKEYTISIIQEKLSILQICDADTDVIFDSETMPLTIKEYQKLRDLALKSAKDFKTMYLSIPIKNKSMVPMRKTFYGMIPTAACEMYEHTKNVNSYYFGEIQIQSDNEPDIYTCRLRAFETLEAQPQFLNNPVFEGSNNEQWSLRKVCRRFVWHDRIHAKAMFKGAAKLFGEENVENPFCFIL